MPAPAKVVLLDLDATLTCHRTAFTQWAQAFSRENDVPLSWLMEAEERWAGQRAEFFRDLQRTFKVGESVLSMQHVYRRRTAELVPHRPDVCAALDLLVRDGWRLGLVTNGESTAQRTKLRQARLERFFPRGVAISSELGIRKPDPAFFHLALDDLGARGSTAYVVGDDPRTDIQGAINAGLTPVWVSHGREPGPGDPRPAYVADTVVDAIEWVRTAAAQELPTVAA